MLTFVVLAASGGTTGLGKAPSFDIWNLVQFGILGVVLACVIAQRGLVPEWALRQERDRSERSERELRAENERLRGQVDRLQEMVETRMIPALTLTTEVVAKYTEEQTKSRLEADLRDGRR